MGRRPLTTLLIENFPACRHAASGCSFRANQTYVAAIRWSKCHNDSWPRPGSVDGLAVASECSECIDGAIRARRLAVLAKYAAVAMLQRHLHFAL